MGCFHQLMVCSCGCRKTNKNTNIHSCMNKHTFMHECMHAHAHTFWKLISRNQAHAHSWPTVGCGRALFLNENCLCDCSYSVLAIGLSVCQGFSQGCIHCRNHPELYHTWLRYKHNTVNDKSFTVRKLSRFFADF